MHTYTYTHSCFTPHIFSFFSPISLYSPKEHIQETRTPQIQNLLDNPQVKSHYLSQGQAGRPKIGSVGGRKNGYNVHLTLVGHDTGLKDRCPSNRYLGPTTKCTQACWTFSQCFKLLNIHLILFRNTQECWGPAHPYRVLLVPESAHGYD